MGDVPAELNGLSLPQLALLVELENPSLIPACNYSIESVWFGRVSVSGLFGTFLRMLALTLIKSTGSDETAAISLDLGDQVKGLALTSLESWRTATIRIASNAGAPDDAADFVKEILSWIREYQEVERSRGNVEAKYKELEYKIVERCLSKILVQTRKTVSAETGPSPFLRIRRIIRKILGAVEAGSIPFRPRLGNSALEGLPWVSRYTSSSCVQINGMILAVLKVYLELVDTFPDVYGEENYENVAHVIFIARQVSGCGVCEYVLTTACTLVGENPDELIDYFRGLGDYHEAVIVFYQMAIYTYRGKYILSGFDIKIVSLDLEPVCHNIPNSSAGADHFHELKTKLLHPDHQYLLHGTAAAHLESKYNNRYQHLSLEEHCEMRLMRFYEENKSAEILPLAYFGSSKPSCFSCDFVLKHLGLAGKSKRGSSSAKYFVPGTSGKVDATWKFPRIQYARPADTYRIQFIEALLLEELKKSAEGSLMETLRAEQSYGG